MEKLYYNLSEEEFSKGRKFLLWGFAGIFFLGGCTVLISSLILNYENVPAILSLAPFGISLVVAVIAGLATFKGTDLFFLIDDDKIEFRHGVFNPKTNSFKWTDIKELIMPHKQKKAQLIFKDDSKFVINLTWMQKKKTSHIRKHIYHAAREKNINVIKVDHLKD